MKKMVILASLIWWFFGMQVMAQDTVKITFKEAVAMALKHNVAYRTKVNNQETQEAYQKQALFSNFPNVGVTVNSRRVSGQQTQQIDDGIVVDNFTNYTTAASLDASLPLFNMFRRINTYKAEKLKTSAGEEDLERSAQEVIFNVARQYLQVLLSRELLKIADENLKNQEELLQQIEGFVEVGLRTLSDQYNQQSEVARYKAVRYDASIQLMNDLFALAETLQMEKGYVPDIEGIPASYSPNMLIGQPLEEWLALAQDEHPSIKRASLLVHAMDKEAKAARASFFPSLNAYYSYSSFGTSIVDRTFESQFFEYNPSSVIGLNLSIPIFSNFTNKSEMVRGKVALKNQELSLQATQKKVNRDVRLAYANYQAAIGKMATTKVQLQAAEEAEMVISERFTLGLNDYVDLSTATRQLVQAKSDMAQAKFTLYFQEVMLRFGAGVLEFDDVNNDNIVIQ